jgi:hypothetical protein
MPFTVKKLTPIRTDSLNSLGDSVLDLAKYVEDEFGYVASAFQATEPDTIWNRAPPRPRRGTTAYADGTNWNPGFGEGPYWFNGTSWFPEFTPAAWQVPASWLTAWTSYVPTVTCTVGSYTTVSAGGRYKQVGKCAFLTLSLVITTIGTATGYPVLGLPFTAGGSFIQILHGREVAVNGKSLQGVISVGGSTAQIIYYDNTAPAASGLNLSLSGTYETV